MWQTNTKPSQCLNDRKSGPGSTWLNRHKSQCLGKFGRFITVIKRCSAKVFFSLPTKNSEMGRALSGHRSAKHVETGSSEVVKIW